MRNIVVFSGSSHPKLAEEVAKRLGISLGNVTLGQFSNKETSVQVWESVRDLDVYIIQSGCGHVNNNMMELLILINACKMASAAKVTVVLPSFPYSRQSDAPYKRNGMPKRIQPTNAINAPATKQLIEQSEERKEQKLSRLSEGSNSPTRNLPLFTVGPESIGEESPKERPMNGKVSRLEISSTLTPEERTTLIASPMQPSLSSLGLAKTGYKHWVARSGTLVANMIMAAGTNHIITLDLHDPQYQGFFDIPVDNLYGAPLIIKYIKDKINDYKKAVIVSPDAGGAKRASNIAHKLGMTFALIHKERKYGSTSPVNNALKLMPPKSQNVSTISDKEVIQTDNMVLVGNVKDKECILIDDIADTSRTITKAAQILHEHGATKIYAIVTHGVLSGDAPQRIKDSQIDVLVVSNSVPQERVSSILQDRIRVFDVAPLLAEAIRRVHHGESVSYLYEPVDI